VFSWRALRFDWILLAAILLLTAIGLLMIYSATKTQLTVAGQEPTRKLMQQSLWVVLSLIIALLVATFDFARLPSVALPAYLFSLLLLVLVLISGGLIREAQRWISLGPINLQPAEFAKIGVILALASFFATRRGEPVEFELPTRALGYTLVPVLLILAQPDLGTPILLLFVWGTVSYIAGAKIQHLAAFTFAFIMIFMAAWGFGLIRPHQKQRITTFVNRAADTSREGYHLRQSLIAIGSGHLTGQGLFRGPQTQLSFVPDQETDFIFTAIGEELGFVGSVTVVLLFGVVLWRGLTICATARTLFGQLVAAGIVATIFLHVMANIGMTLGMTPVKGLPLPFVSYGGSSLLTNYLALGLLQSIWADRQAIRFD
jgi:rod shape determining protein RodA